MKPRWPHLHNGSKKDSVKRKSTELGVRGLGADAGSTVQVIVPDTAYPPGLSVLVSDAEMMIPTLDMGWGRSYGQGGSDPCGWSVLAHLVWPVPQPVRAP